MRKEDMDQIIAKIAREENVTPAHVRAEMEEAIKIAQNSKNPSTRAKWAAMPHKGDSVSLEEFMDYMVITLNKFR